MVARIQCPAGLDTIHAASVSAWAQELILSSASSSWRSGGREAINTSSRPLYDEVAAPSTPHPGQEICAHRLALKADSRSLLSSPPDIHDAIMREVLCIKALHRFTGNWLRRKLLMCVRLMYFSTKTAS